MRFVSIAALAIACGGENKLNAIDGTNGIRTFSSVAFDTDFETTLGNAATADSFTAVANGAAIVPITGTNAGTYLVLNNGTGAFAANADAIILLGGTSSSTVATTDFVV